MPPITLESLIIRILPEDYRTVLSDSAKLSLFNKALTHKSYSKVNYETLENYGDGKLNAAINTIVICYYGHYNDKAKGLYADLRDRLKGKNSLFSFAKFLNLNELIKTNENVTESVMEDCVEALAECIYQVSDNKKYSSNLVYKFAKMFCLPMLKSIRFEDVVMYNMSLNQQEGYKLKQNNQCYTVYYYDKPIIERLRDPNLSDSEEKRVLARDTANILMNEYNVEFNLPDTSDIFNNPGHRETSIDMDYTDEQRNKVYSWIKRNLNPDLDRVLWSIIESDIASETSHILRSVTYPDINETMANTNFYSNLFYPVLSVLTAELVLNLTDKNSELIPRIMTRFIVFMREKIYKSIAIDKDIMSICITNDSSANPVDGLHGLFGGIMSAVNQYVPGCSSWYASNLMHSLIKDNVWITMDTIVDYSYYNVVSSDSIHTERSSFEKLYTSSAKGVTFTAGSSGLSKKLVIDKLTRDAYEDYKIRFVPTETKKILNLNIIQ